MNDEIKRLLKLSNIPNFRLLDKEQKMLDEWKSKQVEIKPKKRTIPKGFVEMDGIGADGKNTLISAQEAPETLQKKKTTRKYSRKKTTNIVKPSDKEIGEIEES